MAGYLGIDAEPLLAAADGRAHNPYRAARNPLAHRLFTAPRLRGVVRLLLPLGARRFIGERILLKPQSKPAMPEAARDILRTSYPDEPEALENLLGTPARDIRQRWRSL